jgi:hypothetical protein
MPYIIFLTFNFVQHTTILLTLSLRQVLSLLNTVYLQVRNKCILLTHLFILYIIFVFPYFMKFDLRHIIK